MYPYDTPSIDMSTCWQSGNYKPSDVVRVIRDNYTPVNKNAMRNSVGQEISYVQNFVNSKMLGRTNLPVATGYIQEVLVNSGSVYVYNSGTDHYGNNIPVKDEARLISDRLLFQHLDQAPVAGSGYLNMTGFYSYVYNGQTQTQYREIAVNPNQIHLTGSGPTAECTQYDLIMWDLDIAPFRSINMTQYGYVYGEASNFDISPRSGIGFSSARYNAGNFDVFSSRYTPSGIFYTQTHPTGLYAPQRLDIKIDASGHTIIIPTGYLTVMSGAVAYEPTTYFTNQFNYALTVGAHPNGKYDNHGIYVKTFADIGGSIAEGAIKIRGGFGGASNIVYSTSRIFQVGCGNPYTGTDASFTFDNLTNSISANSASYAVFYSGEYANYLKVDQEFGCNGVTPTGMAAIATGTDAAKITAILDVLKNYGMMSKV